MSNPNLINLIIALFTTVGVTNAQMHIEGNVFINNNTEMHVAVAETTFGQGGISTAREGIYGLLSFADQSGWSGADHGAHVDGFTRTYDTSAFSFPVGNRDVFQPLLIRRIDQSSPVDANFNFVIHNNLSSDIGIDKVTDLFYWTVIGKQPAYLALSWNEFSEVEELTRGDLSRLSIVGYDGTLWRIIESQIDENDFITGSSPSLLGGSIRSKSPINLEGYSAFALGATDGEFELLVSQGFTPDGDGVNDTWIIAGIEHYPNALIKVYSRWERVVFVSDGNYQNDWNGVFQNKKEPLPDGSYYYIIDVENDGTLDLSGWIYITR